MKVDTANSRTFGCFLSVVMLLTTTPPLWTHCHQDSSSDHEECCGDRQETRVDDGTHCGDQTARCGVELKHRRDEAYGDCWTIDCSRDASHYHLAWLGMTMRLPVDEQSKQLSDESQHTAFVHETFVAFKERDSSSRIDSTVGLKASNVTGHVSLHLENRTDLPPDAILCDVARRERTGVLVI